MVKFIGTESRVVGAGGWERYDGDAVSKKLKAGNNPCCQVPIFSVQNDITQAEGKPWTGSQCLHVLFGGIRRIPGRAFSDNSDIPNMGVPEAVRN